MRRREGFTLIELMFSMVILFSVLGALTAAAARFHEAWVHVTEARNDLETASRLLRDVKEDLRRARFVGALSSRLSLDWGEGAEIAYEFLSEAGTVRRTGDGPLREYPHSFDAVEFQDRADGTVAVEVELRKLNPRSAFHPRLGIRVFCGKWVR